MKKNMGSADRVIRLIIAAIFVILYFTNTFAGTAGIVLLALAGIFVLTSFISFCPLYTLFGFKTCALKRKTIMRTYFAIAFLLIELVASAQMNVSWVNYPGGVSVATDAFDNVYTAYWDYNPAGDITLTKRNSAGIIQWEEAYDNSNSTLHEVATWVETDSQNNILVSGTIRSGYSNPVNASSLLMKFDPSGNLLWRIVYESDFDGSSTKKCLVDANDNIYVLGLGNSGTGMVTKVKKFNSDGIAQWSYFDNAGIGRPVNFKFTPDNAIIISAKAQFGSINGYAKIDLNGNHIWSYPGVNSLSVGDAAGDVFGNSYLINGSYSTPNTGSVLKKLSTGGSVIWEQANYDLTGFRVEAGSDNQPVISGYPVAGGVGAAFAKYASDGNFLWQNLDADGPNLALLSHAQMKLDANNSAYLAAGTMFAMAVCKVKSDGTSAWTATTTGSYAYVLDFGSDNSIYVVGGTTAKITQTLTGDANCDGGVSVLDVITIVNYIMGFNPDPFCFDNADKNSDGMINLLDAIAIISSIIGD